MNSAVPDRTNNATAIKLRPSTDLLDPFTSSITTSPALKNLAGDGAEIMIGVAGYLMAHSIKFKNYVTMLIVMLVKYFSGYECKFQ